MLHIDGSVAVWGFYTARMLAGAFVGASSWPSAWSLRGPLCGLLALLPVSLATPGCGFT